MHHLMLLLTSVSLAAGNATPETNELVSSDDLSLLQVTEVQRIVDTARLPDNDVGQPTSSDIPSAEDDGIQVLFDSMRFSVVRVQSTLPTVNWFQPYQLTNDQEAVGSAWAVNLSRAIGETPVIPGPVFLTNAHVVKNARNVRVQFPIIGQQYFDAYVPVILDGFDLAIVRLKDAQAFTDVLDAHNTSLCSLNVGRNELTLGLGVAAVGFPLGTSTLKLSTGIISGTEDHGTTCYQTTAPISPGSSGGPLFALSQDAGTALDVIGVNFASSSDEDAQNTNYAIHATHIFQILHELQSQPVTPTNKTNQEVSAKSEHQLFHHRQIQVAPLDAISIEANDALYEDSQGCSIGVFLSHVYAKTALHYADPPVLQNAFLQEVNGITLDSFGMGVTASFLGNPVAFQTIMGLSEHVGDNITLTTCKAGKLTHHVTSLSWRPEYAYGIKKVSEPLYEPEALEYEIFDGVTIMQMSSEHVKPLLRMAPAVGRWMIPEMQIIPRLMVTHVEPGSYASRVLAEGIVVSTVNGQNVTTLEEFREHFVPNGNTWRLVSDRDITFATRFRQALTQQYELASASPANHYRMTPAVKNAAVRLGISHDESAAQG